MDESQVSADTCNVVSDSAEYALTSASQVRVLFDNDHDIIRN